MEEELKKAKMIIQYQFSQICMQDALIQDLFDELDQLKGQSSARIIGQPPAPDPAAIRSIIDLEERRRQRAGFPPF